MDRFSFLWSISGQAFNHRQTGRDQLANGSRIDSGWCNRSADQARRGIGSRRSRLTSFPPDEATLGDKIPRLESLPNFKPEGAAAWPRNTRNTPFLHVGRNACCIVMQPCALLSGWRTIIGIKACRMALVNHHQSKGPSK
jgi:hypothetical protein